MGRPKKSDGQGRPAKLTIYVPPTLFQATSGDRETGRFNEKMNGIIETVYAKGGSTDSIDLKIQEHEAESARHASIAASYRQQRDAIIRELQNQVVLKKAEDAFTQHLNIAVERGVNIKEWAHPDRQDVKGIGWNRAKQIVFEKTGVKL